MQELVVLQRQKLREHDWLLDVFTSKFGRMHIVLNRPTTPPDLFTLYRADWRPSDEWPQIKGWHIQKNWQLSETNLYCGLYLNELLVKLLPQHDAAEALFRFYQSAIEGLQQHDIPDPWLRLFEWQLLQQLGYGFSWESDTNGNAISAYEHYAFVPSLGFIKQPEGFRGVDIMAFAEGARDLPLWRMARTIFRKALEDVLQKPLCSRELLTGMNTTRA